MSAETFILFEAAPGLLLLRVKEWDSIAQDTDAVQEACADAQRFKQLVSCEAFYPFADAAEALETLVGVASGTVPPCMQKFLELHMPAAARQGSSGKSKKKQLAGVGEEVTACALGVCDPTLGKALSNLGYSVVYSPAMLEMHRGVRMHMKALAKPLKSLPLNKFQVGLGHSYSRHLMQLDPRMQDKPIMQSVALIDSLDKTINSFSMKLKEWYGWHFPELVKIVSDTEAYAKTLLVVKQKEEFDEEEGREALLEAVGNSEEIAAQVLSAMKHSMGQEISSEDFENIHEFAKQVLNLCEQRRSLQEYLSAKMDLVSPNLKAVVGDVLGARLISHAGALVSLAKYPASTIQILGAEKALFRALKSRSGRTPKYGLLFHSSFIGRVQQQKHRGRMSRYLASKCALAARIDAFGDEADKADSGFQRQHIFGDKLREQLEERLKYLADGVVPRKNLDVMREAAAEVEVQRAAEAKALRKAKKKKAKAEAAAAAAAAAAAEAEGETAAAAEDEEEAAEEQEKPKKKKKKRHAEYEGEEDVAEAASVVTAGKKKKHKIEVAA
ncbi:nucleolar protein 5A, putative [Eimeria maxima]|uniref:Nucleolar protein 56 n=1 Tax=Eimeria maxima TaxID=5804 RepID=U6M449_EIMMA|nr:nucleolar protein 5A, putative [Eimeria maxima]CDJ56465.1 nucleolar protein 5A, putative [Eimeria maxima]